MTHKKNLAGSLLPMTVTEGVIVNVLPHEQYEFLIPTKDVAVGYGVSSENIRQHSFVNHSEFLEGKHFIKGVSISNTLRGVQPHKMFWTKRGIIRLGFFIKSERAKLFRDWAEELIIKLDEQTDLFGSVVKPFTQLPSKRKHNRLTQDRLVSILADVCKIENSQLRLSISNKLMGREEHE